MEADLLPGPWYFLQNLLQPFPYDHTGSNLSLGSPNWKEWEMKTGEWASILGQAFSLSNLIFLNCKLWCMLLWSSAVRRIWPLITLILVDFCEISWRVLKWNWVVLKQAKKNWFLRCLEQVGWLNNCKESALKLRVTSLPRTQPLSDLKMLNHFYWFMK